MQGLLRCLRSEQYSTFFVRFFAEKPIIVIPRDRITTAFARSSGPGGQNVNKVNTKADIRFKVDEADWIPLDVRKRLYERRRSSINNDGELVITSSKTRSQSHNLDDAFDKLESYIDEVALPPKERIPTKPPPSAKEHRHEDKRRNSAKKQARRSDE